MPERLRLPPPEPKPKRKQIRDRRVVKQGRGRRAGIPNKLSQEQVRAAAMTGELPHQFMLRIMRLGVGAYIGGYKVKGKQRGGYKLTWADIKWATKAAAPYFAARLASIQLKPDNKPPVVIQIDPNKLKGLNPAELSRILAALLAASAPPTVINGEVISNGSNGNGTNGSADQDIIDTADASLYERTLN